MTEQDIAEAWGGLRPQKLPELAASLLYTGRYHLASPLVLPVLWYVADAFRLGTRAQRRALYEQIPEPKGKKPWSYKTLRRLGRELFERSGMELAFEGREVVAADKGSGSLSVEDIGYPVVRKK